MHRKVLAAGGWVLLGTLSIALRMVGHWYPVQALVGLLGVALTRPQHHLGPDVGGQSA